MVCRQPRLAAGWEIGERMPEITAITPQKKDKARVNLFLDGRFYCGMQLETVVKFRLRAGENISEEQLSAMQLESEKQTALDKALSHITATMKTEKDVADFLKKKGYLPEVVSYVTAKMKEYGYLDDAAYAVRYAESARARKGGKLIALELRRKGVPAADAEAAVEALGDETESAKAVLAKYLRGKNSSDPATLRKAFSHLLSKGFDYDTARAALGGIDEDSDL